MSDLHLHLKREHFEAILCGDKKYEYRLYNRYWRKRLKGKDFLRVVLMLGYPSKNDDSRKIYRMYEGYQIKTITHREFGNKPVKVFAIRVN